MLTSSWHGNPRAGHGVGVFCLCALKFDNSFHKEPIQLDMFTPSSTATSLKSFSKHLSARKVLMFIGSMALRILFAELKSDNHGLCPHAHLGREP